jgi:hypothetical protein
MAARSHEIAVRLEGAGPNQDRPPRAQEFFPVAARGISAFSIDATVIGVHPLPNPPAAFRWDEG